MNLKENTLKNENDGHPNTIQIDLIKDDMIKVHDISNEWMKRKIEFGLR